MERVIENVVLIDAPPTVVWAILTDLPARGEWDPYYREISGRLEPGATLTVRAQLTEKPRLVTSRPRVVALEPHRRLAWTNRMVLPGLLDSRNDFVLTAPSPGTTRLDQRERFSGLLVTASRRALDAVEAKLELWSQAVKARAERIEPAGGDQHGRPS